VGAITPISMRAGSAIMPMPYWIAKHKICRYSIKINFISNYQSDAITWKFLHVFKI